MKRLLFLFLILIFVAGVDAAIYDVNIVPVDDIIFHSEEAVYKVTIENNQNFNDKVTYSISDLDWNWEKKFFSIAPGDSITFDLVLSAPTNAPTSVYSLGFKVYSSNNPENYVYDDLIVNLVSNMDLLQVKKVDDGNGLDPKKDKNVLKLSVKNVYDFELNDFTVTLDSDAFKASKVVSFGDAELKTIEFDVDVNPNALEGDHDLNILIKKGSEVYVDEVRRIRIGEYSNLNDDISEDYGFLTKNIFITKSNNGNTVVIDDYVMTLSFFDKVFSSVSPKPSLIEKENGQYFYTWNFELQPGEDFRINLVVNYRDPLFLLIGIIVIIYIIYYLSETGIILNKKVLTVKNTKGIGQMKVLLYVRNKGKRRIREVRIVDILHDVKKLPDEYGAVRPNKIKRRGNDVVLVWTIANLLGKEERILSYKISAETAIKAPIKLPGAMARFKIGSKQYIVRSNP